MKARSLRWRLTWVSVKCVLVAWLVWLGCQAWQLSRAHYGFWDETLNDFDDKALFGMARKLREHYGPVTIPADESHRFAA